MKAALVTYVLFALSFILLPQHPLFILISMALWGIGFELILFSDFHFIDESLAHPQHAIGWSVIKTFTGVAYMIGPLVASFLFERSIKMAPVGALLMIVLSGLWFIWLAKSMNRNRELTEKTERKHSIVHEFRVWQLLLPKLWPVLLFIFMATVVDATFWTIGSVLSENLKELHPFGGFLVTVYMLPSLFAYFIGSWLGRFLGKKRTAFMGGILAGISFVFVGFTNDILILLSLVFVASFFLSLSTPEIYGAVEDYIERLGQNANALVGLENSVTSLSFIVGPILAGAIARYFGDQITFTVIGAMLFGISLLAIIIVPRKIHLPHQLLAKA